MADLIDNERFRKLLLSMPEKAIKILYDHYYHSLFRIARLFTQDENVAEEIVQDTFFHVWENYKKLAQHHERSIQHYLVRVVKYKAITHYKAGVVNKRQEIRFLNGHDLQRSHPSAESGIIQSEIVNEIREMIATFPFREKQCLLMKIDDELTPDQIADKLKVSRKAVERSLTSANKRLRKWMMAGK